MNKLRVGVVGVGYLGRYHAEKYADMDAVDLTAVVDVDSSRAQAVAAALGAPAYTRYQDILGKVDAVSIAVPTVDHHRVAMEFLNSGSDVLIEKPMSVTLAEADDLLCAATAHDRIIMVGHLERFNPAVIRLKNEVFSPLFVECQRLTVFRGRGTDVSVVLDLMIHDIDILLSLVKSPLADIRGAGFTAVSRQADIANARLEFKNGCVASLAASRISSEDRRQLCLCQREGMVTVDYANRTLVRTIPDPGTPSGTLPGMRVEEVGLAPVDALKEEIADFVSAVLLRRPPEVTGEMGREALRVALEIDRRIALADHRILA